MHYLELQCACSCMAANSWTSSHHLSAGFIRVRKPLRSYKQIHGSSPFCLVVCTDDDVNIPYQRSKCFVFLLVGVTIVFSWFYTE